MACKYIVQHVRASSHTRINSSGHDPMLLPIHAYLTKTIDRPISKLGQHKTPAHSPTARLASPTRPLAQARSPLPKPPHIRFSPSSQTRHSQAGGRSHWLRTAGNATASRARGLGSARVCDHTMQARASSRSYRTRMNAGRTCTSAQK